MTLDVPEHELRRFEWLEDGKPYREFLVPAPALNHYGPPAVYEEPDYLTCAVVLANGSICMAEADQYDEDSWRPLCAAHRS